MPTLDTFRKQAKLMLRWHRDGDYGIGEKLRRLERYRSLTDREALALKFTLTLAQEIVAVEASHESWAKLKAAVADTPKTPHPSPASPILKNLLPGNLRRKDLASGTQMVADISGKIGLHGSRRKAPFPVGAFEAIGVASAGDRLQGEARRGLEHRVIRARVRHSRLFVDLDDEIGGDMAGARRAVVIDLQGLPREAGDRLPASDRRAAAEREVALVQKRAEAIEIAVIHEEGVSCDEVFDIAFAAL
jgi:hypothetical protein